MTQGSDNSAERNKGGGGAGMELGVLREGVMTPETVVLMVRIVRTSESLADGPSLQTRGADGSRHLSSPASGSAC